MPTETYHSRRGQLTEYFDRTAVEAWARMTSDAPLSRIRQTVRAGRDTMRATLLHMLPDDLSGARVLDAGCGTGQLAYEAAKRGGDVVAIDVATNLVELARTRHSDIGLAGTITYLSGDMLDPSLGDFDYVVAMDSLIHYRAEDIVRVLSSFAERTHHGIAYTFAPETTALRVMHTAGKLFPRSDRAPAIEPVREARLRTLINRTPTLEAWHIEATRRVSQGFYTSQAMELVRR